MMGHTDVVYCCAFSTNDVRIVSCSADHRVKVCPLLWLSYWLEVSWICIFCLGPLWRKYSDSNVERLLCITNYRDVTFQCGSYLLLSLVFNEWGFSNKNDTCYLYPLLWKWYVTQSCAEKRAVYQFLFRFGTAVMEKNYWLSVATTKKYSSACFHQMTRKLFPALLTRLSRYWYYFTPYTSVGIFFILFLYNS